MISGVALAEPAGQSTTTVRQSDHGTVVTKRYMNHHGAMVTKRKVINNGIVGSSVSRSRTVTDPMTGTSYTRTHITHGE
jgi:hypothetical protein